MRDMRLANDFVGSLWDVKEMIHGAHDVELGGGCSPGAERVMNGFTRPKLGR